jgi:hypothetical protein
MNYNGSEIITLSRNELYEKIWSTPTIKLAKDFGLSDVGLGKICKKHMIPKPPLGYRAKLAHGKRVAAFPYRRLIIINWRSSKPEKDQRAPPLKERSRPSQSMRCHSRVQNV